MVRLQRPSSQPALASALHGTGDHRAEWGEECETRGVKACEAGQRLGVRIFQPGGRRCGGGEAASHSTKR